MRLLIDMNLSPTWVDLLGAAGIVAGYWAHVGDRGSLGLYISAYTAIEGCANIATAT